MSITPAELAATVAVALGIPTNSVKNYDRKLMEAGLRTKKGHGRGSAIMGAEDAAVLLAAISSCDEIGRAPDCVRKLYRTPYAGVTGNNPKSEFAELAVLCEIVGATENDVDTFGKALVAILRHLVSKPDPKHYFSFEVSIACGAPYAVDLIIAMPKKIKRIEFYRAGDAAKTIAGGLRVKREVMGSALVWVAEIIAGRAPASTEEIA